MPATPPSSPPPPDDSSSSFQFHHEAMRHQKRLHRDVRSLELRRIPSPLTMHCTFVLPPPPPISIPVTLNGRTFNHLPSHLTDGMRNLQPFPTSRRTNTESSTPILQSNVSFAFSLFNNLLTCCQFITSAAASSSSTTLPAPVVPHPIPFPPPPPVGSSSMASLDLGSGSVPPIPPIPSAPYRETLTPAQLRALYVPLPTRTLRTSVSFVYLKKNKTN